MQRGEPWLWSGIGCEALALLGAWLQIDEWPTLPTAWLLALGLLGLTLGLVGLVRSWRP